MNRRGPHNLSPHFPAAPLLRWASMWQKAGHSRITAFSKAVIMHASLAAPVMPASPAPLLPPPPPKPKPISLPERVAPSLPST